MSSTIIGLISGAVGAMLGAAIGWLANRRQLQANTILDMHREYQGAAMVRSRELAGRLVDRDPTRTLVDLWQVVDPLEAESLWNVIYFYERLWMVIKYRYVNTKLVPELFGATFNWWFEKSFRRQLIPLDDPTKTHVASLREWLYENADTEMRSSWDAYLRTWPAEKPALEGTAPACEWCGRRIG